MRPRAGGALPVVLALLALYSAGAGEAVRAQAPRSIHENYPTGDACLFCHRNDIGSTWLDNAHAWTTRPASEPPLVGLLPEDATHVIGRDQAAYDIRAVDLDRDGDLDLLVAGQISRNVVWYENPRKQKQE